MENLRSEKPVLKPVPCNPLCKLAISGLIEKLHLFTPIVRFSLLLIDALLSDLSKYKTEYPILELTLVGSTPDSVLNLSIDIVSV